jgi:hypothetical protein
MFGEFYFKGYYSMSVQLSGKYALLLVPLGEAESVLSVSEVAVVIDGDSVTPIKNRLGVLDDAGCVMRTVLEHIHERQPEVLHA